MILTDPHYDPETLADVYYCSRKTQHAYRQVLWRMTVDDAMKVCESPETCHPGSWMMCWTIHELVDPRPICFVDDDGRFNDLFKRLGVTVLMSKQMLINGTATIPEVEPSPLPTRTISNIQQLDMFEEEAA